MPKDHELMLAVRNGDTHKLGTLFERHHRNLYTFFLYLTKNEQASEDLVQDVFYRMLKYRKTYRDDSTFNSWMFTVARNARIDYFRKHVSPSKYLDIIDTIESPEPQPDILMERKHEVHVLKQALDMLPSDKRELIVMFRFNELSYHEIGSVLGCTESALRVRMYRAMRELAKTYMILTGERSHEL